MGASFAKSIYTEPYWDLAAVTAIGAANVASMLVVSDDTIKTMYACWLAVSFRSYVVVFDNLHVQFYLFYR